MAIKLELKGYKALMYALFVILLSLPILQGFTYLGIIFGVVLMGALLVAVRAIANKRHQVVLSALLGTAALVGYFGNQLGFGAWFEPVGLLGFGLFFLTVGIIILTNIMRHIDKVTSQMIYGAINAYLLIGLAFAFAHALVEFIQPGSISGLESLSMGDDNMMPFMYYSFVTLTTLGYGDLSPVTGPAASVAYIEAIFGQLYIAIMIARLMGLYVASETRQG